MSDSKQPANDAGTPRDRPSPQPSSAHLSPGQAARFGPSRGEGEEDDPEIEALLEFEPVPRKREVEGAWTPELQREFIARLAVTGSIGRVAEEMGKTETGVRKLYRSPAGAAFRAAWDAAVELAKQRKAARTAAEEPVVPGSRPPSLDHRRKHAPSPDPSSARLSPGQAARFGPARGEGQEEISEDQKWDLLHHIGLKFMRKVAAEREARLNGEIVAADFYLRQITVMEVMLDLTADAFGWDAEEVLRALRRGDHGIVEIVSTPLADWMDRSRRLWWMQEGEPERPPHPDVRFLKRERSADGAYATQQDYEACTGMRPPPGIGQAQWDAMGKIAQHALIEQAREEDAAEQREWERRARAEWEAREAQTVRGVNFPSP